MPDMEDPDWEQPSQNGKAVEVIQDPLRDLEEADVASSLSSSNGSKSSFPTLESILNEDIGSYDEGLLSGAFADAEFRNRNTFDLSELEQSYAASAESIKNLRQDPASRSKRDSLIKLVKLRDVSSSFGKNAVDGNPTVIHCGANIIVGTSTGFAHVFDLSQKTVCKCAPPSKSAGPVSAVDINRVEKLLLVGFASGTLALYDLPSGKLSKVMEDLHLFESSILSIRFTDDPSIAIFTDNGGSAYALEVRSTLGRKNGTSTCIFSGSKGEAFVAEPLRVASKIPSHRLAEMFVVAVASLNKVIIAELKPALRSVFSFPYNATPARPPVLEWHIVTMHSEKKGKSVEPVLAVATGQNIVFVQVSSAPDDVIPKCSFIQRTSLDFIVINLKWINNYMIAVMDTSECLHIVDIRSQTILDTIDLSIVGLVYQSSFYKGLATSRATSQALASVGNIACLQSIGSFHGQIILLGTEGVFVASLRLWFERVDRLVNEGQFLEALRLLLEVTSGQAKGVLGLTKDPKERRAILRRQLRHLVEVVLDDCLNQAPQTANTEEIRDHFMSIVPTCMNACISCGDTDYLFGEFYDRFGPNMVAKTLFLENIEPLILNDELREVSPGVMQDLIELHKARQQFGLLESLIVKLNVRSFDLHNVIAICRQHGLFDGLGYIYTLAFQDARTPLEEYLMVMRKALLASQVLSDEMVALGNKLIVFVNCCLHGLQYPAGSSKASSPQLASDVLQTLLARHSRNPKEFEPAFVHLRTLLSFDTTEILNVLAMAFAQPHFNDAKGCEIQQQFVDRLQQIFAQGDQFEPAQISAVSTFIARMMTKSESKIVINRMLIEQTLETLCSSDLRSRHDEREAAVLEMYHCGVLNHISDNMVIRLAETAKFWRLCEILYEKHGMYDKLLFCYLDDPARKSQSFAFLQRILISPLYEKHEKDMVREAFVERFPELLALDFQKTVLLTYSSMFSEVLRLCKRLGPDVWNQYLFMREVFNFVSRSAVATQSDSSLFPVLYHNVLIDLMCEVQPATVFDHIRSNDHYDVDQALSACRTFGIVRGVAYLLEKKGSTEEAFEVLLTELRRVMDGYLVSQRHEISQEVYEKSYQGLKDTLDIVMDFCQRSSARTDQAAQENMYQQVLRFMLDAINSSADVVYEGRRSDLRRLSADLLKSMTGQVDVLVFLKRVLDDAAYSHGKFGELRELLLGILDTYSYEHVLLSSTRNMIRKDIHDQVSQMKKTAARAVRIRSATCGLCRSSLRRFPSSEEAQAKLLVFRCGHAFHATCVKDSAQTSSGSPRESDGKCPSCDR